MSQLGDERLSDREQKLLTRLFADPLLYPQTLKGWLISYLEGSELVLPMASVNGLLEKLGQIDGQLGASNEVIGGNSIGTTDASGRINISFSPVAAVKSIVVTQLGSAPAAFVCSFNVSSFSLNGFQVTVWNIPLNAAYANQSVGFSWLAYVTPQ